MKYSSPELVLIGRAEVLVMGAPFESDDHVGSIDTQPMTGFALGLDD